MAGEGSLKGASSPAPAAGRRLKEDVHKRHEKQWDEQPQAPWLPAVASATGWGRPAGDAQLLPPPAAASGKVPSLWMPAGSSWGGTRPPPSSARDAAPSSGPDNHTFRPLVDGFANSALHQGHPTSRSLRDEGGRGGGDLQATCYPASSAPGGPRVRVPLEPPGPPNDMAECNLRAGVSANRRRRGGSPVRRPCSQVRDI